MPALSRLTLEEGRRGLVRFLTERRPQGSAGNAVTLVFDGREDIIGGELFAGIKVLFSKGETADDLIKKIVEDAARSGDIVLVTDDRELGFFCRTHGAHWWWVKDFLARALSASGTKAPRGKGRGSREEGKTISGALESRVNQEMKEYWLR